MSSRGGAVQPESRVLVRYGRERAGDAVASDLAEAGMHVDRVLGRLRVVSGTVAPDRVAVLGAVPGVQAVEPDREVRPA